MTARRFPAIADRCTIARREQTARATPEEIAMTTPNRCRFQDCDELIRKDYFLCYHHFTQQKRGIIDQCPRCENYKNAPFAVCRVCHRQPAGAPQSSPTDAAPRDDRAFPSDREAAEFFVYILNLDGGAYYIGQTRELHERLLEHRNNMSPSTQGRNPKLVWFTTAPTRDEAAGLEQRLQQLNATPTGRREINRWVVQFKRLVDELDYTPSRPTVAAPSAEPEPPQPSERPPGGIRRLFSRNR